MASDDGVVPPWLSNLASLGKAAEDDPGIIGTLIDFGREPSNFVREIVFNIILAGIANFVFTTTGIIDKGVNAVLAPFTDARVSITGAIQMAVDAFVGPVTALNTFIAGLFADALGVGAFPFLVALAVLEIALVIRVGRAVLPALSDALGSVPVLGSALDAILTFGLRLLGGGDPS